MFASYKTKILPFYNTSVDLLLLFMWHLVFEHEDYVKFEVEHVGRQPYRRFSGERRVLVIYFLAHRVSGLHKQEIRIEYHSVLRNGSKIAKVFCFIGRSSNLLHFGLYRRFF